MELGEFGIRANAILPGPWRDRAWSACSPDALRATTARSSRKRANALRNQSLKYFTEAGEVAALAVFLASDAARSISGQSLPVDGDMHRSV